MFARGRRFKVPGPLSLFERLNADNRVSAPQQVCT